MRTCALVACFLAGACSAVGAPGPATAASRTADLPPSPSPAECPAGGGRTYEVGEGKAYPSIGRVPWEKLSAGDRVLVHWREQPYREKILLSSRGTAEQPIRVCGVAGPGGALPVISGEDATTRSQSAYRYAPTQERGLLVITPGPGARWGFKPGHLVIQGLELRSAWRGPVTAPAPRTFKDNEGKTRAYNSNVACIFVERGEWVTIRGNTLTDCGYGLFVASGETEEVVSREILVEGNWIHGNGYDGVDRRHNVYSEAIGITYQANRFGPLRPGARGNQLKDRSAGTVVRYNWIEGGAHLLDLVEPEDGAPLSLKDPRYHDTWVYGNVLVAGPEAGSNLVHYGGDNGNVPTYRKGTLHFFHNTVVVRADEKARWNTNVFRVETNDETVDAWNNVIWKTGTTHLTLMKAKGTLRLGPNWISGDHAQWQYLDRKDGTISGLEALVAGDDPGFVAPDRGDYRPRASSAAASGGGALPAELPGERAIAREYAPHQRIAPRTSAGAGAALGAFAAAP